MEAKKRIVYWNDGCNGAFAQLKQQLNSPPILSYPDFAQPFVLSVDALDAAMGMSSVNILLPIGVVNSLNLSMVVPP